MPLKWEDDSYTLSLFHLSPCIQPSTNKFHHQSCEQPKSLWYWSVQLCLSGPNFTVQTDSICLIVSYIRVIIENALYWARCWAYYSMVSLWFLGRQHVITYKCCGLYGDHRACVVITKCYDHAVCTCIVWKILFAQKALDIT